MMLSIIFLSEAFLFHQDPILRANTAANVEDRVSSALFSSSISTGQDHTKSESLQLNGFTMTNEKLGETSTTTIQKVHRYDSPFSEKAANSKSSSSLIILNTPITFSKKRSTIGKRQRKKLSGVLRILWESSNYRVCADGGANRLYDATMGENSSLDDDTLYLPDIITGDLDSLKPHVREYYEAKGVKIIQVEDQNFHDLDKAFMAVEKWMLSLDREKVASVADIAQSKDSGDGGDSGGETSSNIATSTRTYIYGGFGGRFDQEMGCVNALFSWGNKPTFRHTSMAIYGEENCTFLLPAMPIKNEIRIRFPDFDRKMEDELTSDEELVGEGPTCGLIPLGSRCETVYTSGLKWNLEGDVPLEFGGLVSSSNRVIEEVVTIVSSSPLLFTTEMIVI